MKKQKKKSPFLLSTFYFLFSRRSGQSVAEAIVALGVLVVGLLGILALLSRSLGLSRFISNNYVATYLAGEGVEIVKNLIDANVMNLRLWNQNLSAGNYEATHNSQVLESSRGRTLFYDDASKLYKYSGSSQTGFKREIRLTTPSPDEIQVNVIVRWTTKGAQSSVNLEDHFYNWRQ